jgi:glucose-6-phosphate 1-dehydrogenase
LAIVLARMDESNQLDELLSCRQREGRKEVEPCTIIIFGASGDLTSRKLIPALYHLHCEGRLPEAMRVIGFARREKTDESWRAELREALGKFSRSKTVDETKWAEFAERVVYCRGDLTDAEAYKALRARLDEAESEQVRENVLIYLAISPSQFSEVVKQCHEAGLLNRDPAGASWQRIVVEKPFGRDLASAQALNESLMRHAHEKQIFRIDHYLGKETVQNILMFRFSNSIFEQVWDRQSIDNIQITVSEQHSVGARGGYYEEAGAMRDMVQNHLLQALALVAMEPPVSLEAEAIRDEKVKLLQSIRDFDPEKISEQVVRGQYFAGEIDGEARPGYRQEPKVDPKSNVETFVALKLFIDNWRWSGVPFYLRTGKNLPMSASEVRVQFRPTPNILYAAECDSGVEANSLTLRLQPNEGISLRFNGKVPGASMEARPVRMHFSYDSEFGAYTPEAYERLLLEAIAGDATLFIRRDEVETAWGIVDAIRESWSDVALTNREIYAAGTWGPVAADDLMAADGHKWRDPQPLK